MNQRPPVHYRQPRAQVGPQAVRVRETRYGELFAVCMMFLIGCLFALSVLVLVLLAALWMVGL
jgi:hypothetical protein